MADESIGVGEEPQQSRGSPGVAGPSSRRFDCHEGGDVAVRTAHSERAGDESFELRLEFGGAAWYAL